MLDEPFNGMDPEGIVWMRGLLRSLAAEGRAVLVSSHLMRELQDTADHLIIVGRGRVIADTPVADLIAAGRSLERAYLDLTRDSVEYRAEP
jgi:ABC-2 type transport system ATP-binding protein